MSLEPPSYSGSPTVKPKFFLHLVKDVGSSNIFLSLQCRLRGKIDSNGVVSSFLEERLNMGVNFILSAEVDHRKKDYKFGFGMTVGE
ncbi:hypothetical protein HPP92_026586 [Vanilla planifolia]|uniref:Uncharacterized protein n=1 Tax=Vanilla planifolia TaxID=51239 RepID=A0A835PBT5_VANPL|nr:hypothetical protein HPP92_026586 [Vanilla planifolia]